MNLKMDSLFDTNYINPNPYYFSLVVLFLTPPKRGCEFVHLLLFPKGQINGFYNLKPYHFILYFSSFLSPLLNPFLFFKPKTFNQEYISAKLFILQFQSPPGFLTLVRPECCIVKLIKIPGTCHFFFEKNDFYLTFRDKKVQ
jgi:hypothetical protein